MKINKNKLLENLDAEKKLILAQRKVNVGNPIVVARLEGMILGLSIFMTYLEESEEVDK